MAKTELITTLHKGTNTDIDVFPNIKKQNIPNQAIDESKLDPTLLQKITPVVANPTVAGSESDLTSIQIGDTKYKVTGGGGGGSEVIANPTLVGDEDSLTGLEVDGTKYKVSGERDITSQEIAEYFDICNVQASVEEEGDELVLELENVGVDYEDGKPVLIFNADNVEVENKVLEIEE